jgi:hypothetical protein
MIPLIVIFPVVRQFWAAKASQPPETIYTMDLH